MNTPTLKKVYAILEKEVTGMPLPIMDLVETHGNDPFKVLVGTVLSARTKDQTTAVACKKLFKEVRSFEELRKVSLKQLEQLIYPVGFYTTKAKNLKTLAKQMLEFDDEVPQTIDELVTLAGVGRKTANLVLSIAFNIDALCVDIHVDRIMNRLGYIRTKTPLETEMRLRRKLPIAMWSATNRILVAYGQHLCTPISPHCTKCKVKNLCEQKGVKSSR